MTRYADNFEPACPLDSLSWVTMEPKARLCRLASRFLKEESKIKGYKEKGSWEVTAGVVKPWLLSLYEPPRGQFSSLMKELLPEIARQREIRKKRAENRPWKWPETSVADRRNAVSKGLYGVGEKDYEGKWSRSRNTCTTITTISGILMALDVQSDANIRIYMRHRETGRVKVIITKKRTSYSTPERDLLLTTHLLYMAPVAVERAIFGGSRLTIDFDREGFDLDGTFHPWRNVLRVVEGPKKAMRTAKKYTDNGQKDDE